MAAYLNLDDLEDKAIHLSDVTFMLGRELRTNHPELLKELQLVTNKILKVAREQYEVNLNG